MVSFLLPVYRNSKFNCRILFDFQLTFFIYCVFLDSKEMFSRNFTDPEGILQLKESKQNKNQNVHCNSKI